MQGARTFRWIIMPPELYSAHTFPERIIYTYRCIFRERKRQRGGERDIYIFDTYLRLIARPNDILTNNENRRGTYFNHFRPLFIYYTMIFQRETPMRFFHIRAILLWRSVHPFLNSSWTGCNNSCCCCRFDAFFRISRSLKKRKHSIF